MTQRKIDEDFFSLTPASSRTNKRTRANETTTSNRDEFDDLFETTSTSKRRRTNNKQAATTTVLNDLIEIDGPSSSISTAKKSGESKSSSSTTKDFSLKVKRSVLDDDEELFGSGTRKRARRQVEPSSASTFDLFDIFKTRSNTSAAPPPTSKTDDDFKTPLTAKRTIGGKKIKMFFDDSDLLLLRDELNEQNNTKDYVQIKPMVITGGRWLSKEDETKTKSKDDSSSLKIPDDQRNLMHIQFVSLIVDDQVEKRKKSRSSQSTTRKSSGNPHQTILEGKSFQKQLVVSDSNIVRKENLKSCYNALLEDINKPRVPKKSAKSTTNAEDDPSDDEQSKNVDFFDLPTRKKKF